jgi:Flp pilus assembly protein TadD
MVRRVPFLLVLLVFLAAAGIAGAGPLEPPAPGEKWITLRVDEFTLISNVSQAETAAIARDVLRMRRAIGEITKLKMREVEPTRIFVFASERSFAPYRKVLLGRMSETTQGAYITSDGGNFIIMKRDDADRVDRTVYHELTHYFFENTTGNLPLWLSEGLAEYYSTFETSGDSVLVGRLIVEHVRWLRNQTLIPLRELLATTVDSPAYNEGIRKGVFYAQSWALVHYLLENETRSAQLGRFVRLLREDTPVDEAFASAFGKSYGEVETELRAYVGKQRFTYARHPLAALSVPEPAKPEPLSRDALLFELGHLLAYGAVDSPDHARRFLDEALAANPAHAGAYADLGRMHHAAGRRREADAALARAVELGSDDPKVHLLAGLSALEQFKGVREPATPSDALLTARRALERSAELDPGSAPAWTGVGATYIYTNEDPAPGIAALERSLALVPGDVNAAFNLVQLYARAGRFAAAKRLIDTVLASGATSEMTAFARESLRVATTNASIARINDAIEKANAGRYAEASAILDAVFPELDDAEMLMRVSELRGLLARMKK